MKKLIALLLSFAMIACMFAGCNSGESKQPEATNAPAEGTVEKVENETPEDVALGIELANLTLYGTLVGKYEGQTITVATCEGDFATALENQIKTFEEITGATVELNTFPGDSYMEKIQMDLNAGGNFDVVLMPIANIHGYATTGLVADMTTMMSDWASASYDVDDFLTGLFNTYARYNDKLVALPYKPDIIMNFYRTDLFGDAELQAKFKDMYDRRKEVYGSGTAAVYRPE